MSCSTRARTPSASAPDRPYCVRSCSSLSWLAQVEVDVLQERLTEVLAAAGGQCTVVHWLRHGRSVRDN